MSIKAIETQAMVARSPDYARDNSAMAKKPELTQEFLAAQQKATAEQNQSRIQQSTETEMDNIRTDDEGNPDGTGDGGTGHRRRKEDKQADNDMLVPAGNNVIDIKI